MEELLHCKVFGQQCHVEKQKKYHSQGLYMDPYLQLDIVQQQKLIALLCPSDFFFVWMSKLWRWTFRKSSVHHNHMSPSLSVPFSVDMF